MPATCLLDKNIVRAVFEARVRVQRGQIPLPHQAKAAIGYQALQQAGLTTYVPTVFRSAQSSSDAVVPVDIRYCQAGQQLRRIIQ